MSKNKLKEFRQARRLTQKQLANYSGISDTHISNIERQAFTPGIYTAYSIIDGFNRSKTGPEINVYDIWPLKKKRKGK